MREWRRWWHWDHNAHFHSYLLECLPSSFERGLDVGCGTGTSARALAARAALLDAIDVEPTVVDAARRSALRPPDIRWLTADVLTSGLPLQAYDVVTAVASLHHLPLERGLRRLAELVRPRGHLAFHRYPLIWQKSATAGDSSAPRREPSGPGPQQCREAARSRAR